MKKIIILIITLLLITACSINSPKEATRENISKDTKYYQDKYKDIIEYLITSYDFYTTDTINIEDNNNDVKGYIYYVIASSYKNEEKNTITLEELQDKAKKYFGIDNFEYNSSDYDKKTKEYNITKISLEKTETTIIKVNEKNNEIELECEIKYENNNNHKFIITVTNDDNNYIKKIYSKV